MIIGGNFNNKSGKVLSILAAASAYKTDVSVSVSSLVEQINMDRTEIKQILTYLSDKGLIEFKTIGGPYLYGDISITEKGLEKVRDL